MGLQEADRSPRVREAACQCHPRRLMVAIRETQRRDARVRESFARRDDVRLVRMPSESMKHRDAADGTRVR